ncbi:MAG: NADH-quinone oxidoreductase subunit H [Spirochaetia bacterium]|jgi:formate hydrogenlyase subunit 4|nr:NADH-quinone oxidoreductase subunit H [Spirochaetia bacterium]
MVIIIHLLFLLLFPPLLIGVINKTKALFAGRRGAPFLQRYFDIFKLLKKGMVISSAATWVFRAGPVISLVTAAAAGLFLPIGKIPPLISFPGDFILFAYMFALSRFFTTSAALDTGSAFEGMGSAREVTFAVLIEPALFFVFLVLARLSGSFSLEGMLSLSVKNISAIGNAAPLLLTSVGLFIVLLAENCRIPVDDPNTHLELTMIHEVMVLDHSGPLLGLIEYGSAVKLFVTGSLLLNLILPLQLLPVWTAALVLAGGLLLLSFVIGMIESIMARLRMPRVPALLIASILLCGSAFIMLVR